MKYQFGDIFEVKTSKGLAYFQYVNSYNKPPYYGDLIRILAGFFETRPTNLDQLSNKKELVYFFTPLHYRNQQQFFKKVGSAKVPKKFEKIPLFRMADIDRDFKTKIVKEWWIWDNDNEIRVGKINNQLKKLPDLGTTNFKAVLNALEKGYLPQNDIHVVGIGKGVNIED